MADESPKERVDRELIELLNEVRVALPGVQVLFAFLLGIPFTNRFHDVNGTTEAMYIVALLATAAASAFLIAPTAVHRLRFRDERKEEILQLNHRLALVGMTVLALSIGASVYVVLAFLHGARTGALVAGGVTLLLAGVWFVLPIATRLR